MDFNMKKFLPILLALFLFLPSTVYGQGVIDVSVTAGIDDVNCEDDLTPPQCNFTASFGYVWAGDRDSGRFDRKSYMLFKNIEITQGTVIESANLHLRALSINGVPLTIIRADAADNPIAPITGATDWELRSYTSAGVTWNPTVITWVIDTIQTSPDLTAVIQEVINRPGWVSGNNIGIVWFDNRGVGNQGIHWLRGDSWEDAADDPPRLTIGFAIIPPVTPTSIIDGWVAFVGNGLAILIVAFVCGIFLWLVKAPPLMMLICGWLSLLLLFTIGVVSAAIVLIALVGFVGAIFFKVILGTGESA